MAEAGGLVEELKRVVEVVEGGDVERYEADWWPYTSIEKVGRALAVVKPKSEEEVLRVLEACRRWGVGVTCRGGGSSVTGASTPTRTVVLDMSKMDRILRVDLENMFVEVEAGAKLSELEARLNELGYTLGQFPQSFHIATVGGYISTMGTGEYSGKYGGVECACLSLRVALADGSVFETRPTHAPRSSVGPDLTALFVGAEGALGVVLSARLRIRRLDRYVLKLAYRFESFAKAVFAGKRLLELDVHPAVFRAYDESDAAVTLGEPKPTLLLVYGFSSGRVMEAVRAEVAEAVGAEGGVELGEAPVERWLEGRFRYAEALSTLRSMGYMAETADLAASWTSLPTLYEEVRSGLLGVGGVVGVGAHVSHVYEQGACLYFTIILRHSPQAYRALWEKVWEACRRNNATVSHHHGVGILKSKMVKDETPYPLLSRIKRALDPENTLNPGKLF